MKICTVAIGKNITEFTQSLLTVLPHGDIVELRVDNIEQLKLSDLDEIKKICTKPAVFTCRHSSEGGMFSGSEDKRKEIIAYAAVLGFEYIDLEFTTLKNWSVDKSWLQSSKLIASYHNFDTTPSLAELQQILSQMDEFAPDVRKIAVMPKIQTDVDTIYKLIISCAANKPLIAIAMGELGKPTRLVGPLLGSFLTFAAVGNNASAPGQIEAQSLRTIFNLLSSK